MATDEIQVGIMRLRSLVLSLDSILKGLMEASEEKGDQLSGALAVSQELKDELGRFELKFGTTAAIDIRPKPHR